MQYAFKVYRANRSEYAKIIRNRKDFETTVHTNLHESDHKTELYWVPTESANHLFLQVEKNDKAIAMAFAALPEIAKEGFLLDVVGSEIVDTNELEGVASSKNEIIETAKEIQEFYLPKTKECKT